MTARLGILIAALLLTACGGQDLQTARGWAHWRERARAADEGGDAAAAALAYRTAFAVLDPRDEESRLKRAGMAYGAGRAFVRALRNSPEWSAYSRLQVARSAEAFLVTSSRLDPARGWVHLHRALLRDQGDPLLDDADAARASYRAFLTWAASDPPARTKPPGDDAPTVREARARLSALGQAADDATSSGG
jgi:hypothetical protein